MPIIGFDTASAITGPTLDAAIRDGAKYVELYIKWSTPSLVSLIHGKGLAIGLIFETSAERALQGYDAGHADALAFLAAVPTHLGAMPPPTVAPAWTADFDVTEEQQESVMQYGQGWKDAMAGKLRSRCYANGAICAAAKFARIVDFTWVAGGRGMRGTAAFLQTGQEDEYQDVGDKEDLGLPISIDSDVAVGSDLSWLWYPDGARPAQPAAPLTNISNSASPLAALKDAQSYLRLQGLYNGAIDGIWGPQTEAAFSAYYAGRA